MSSRTLSKIRLWHAPRVDGRIARRSFDKPARAVFYVAAVEPDRTAGHGAILRGVLLVDGMKGASASHRCVPPRNRWPQVGECLPVVTDLADPYRMVIRWSER